MIKNKIFFLIIFNQLFLSQVLFSQDNNIRFKSLTLIFQERIGVNDDAADSLIFQLIGDGIQGDIRTSGIDGRALIGDIPINTTNVKVRVLDKRFRRMSEKNISFNSRKHQKIFQSTKYSQK